MIKGFPREVKAHTAAPWNDKLFNTVKQLDEDRRTTFNTPLMKAMFMCKRARPDIESARTSKANESDCLKVLK